VDAQHTTAEAAPDLQLEIAHIVLIDVVGYSKLLVNEQIELLQELNRIVRGTECFRAAEANGKLIRVPTGDGMALLFFRSPEEPAQCALEISKALKDHPHIELRIGVHSGPVNQVTDVNDRTNVAGAGINVAQRVMDCGDAGHILLSKHLADDLVEYRHWRPYLHDLGECEVKYGLRLHLVNLYKDNLGNPHLPEKLKRRRWKQASTAPVRPISALRWPKFALIVVLLVLAIALTTSFSILFRRGSPPIAPSASEGVTWAAAFIPEKSIAVLPFENLSDDKENAYFTEGVGDEILTDLAKIADLKVISRTSVMQYKNAVSHNLREIGEQLGVAHVLEGSVQRTGGRVRVSAQLIDARTDAHLWAEHYDRPLDDVFAIQSEIAKAIADQLQAKLSPNEKKAIEQPPTTDLAAFDLYSRAKLLIEKAVFNEPKHSMLLEAIRLLEEAVTRDPSFVLAYYQLAHAHDQMYLLEFDHTQDRLDLANAAIQSVKRLRPDSGEAHLALAKHLYWGYRDYDRARQALAAARRALPNDPLPFLLTGYIDRREGRWAKATHNMERAVELDPQNFFTLQQIALTYTVLRRYADVAATLDRAVALAPKDVSLRVQRAGVDLDWRANTKPLDSTIQAIIANEPAAIKLVADQWLLLALWERDSSAAGRALSLLDAHGCHGDMLFPRAWCEGRVALSRGEVAPARDAFTRARKEIEGVISQQPDYAQALCALGMIDAALGNKEDAIREGRRAVELLPVTKDSIDGAQLVQYLAVIYAGVGEKDLALEQLRIASSIPGYLSYGSLRLDPLWDPLRGDPRFDKIVASLAPEKQ
jgi:TolB-like protein/class 3 adenylate cyclase/Tfp pilus assembly protein PilF